MVPRELQSIDKEIAGDALETQRQFGLLDGGRTSLSVLQSSCLEWLSAALCFFSTFTGKSQWFRSNPCVQFTSFSLFAASAGLLLPVCFLRATIRWWVFLLQDTTRLTRPGMFPERLPGCLGAGLEIY